MHSRDLAARTTHVDLRSDVTLDAAMVAEIDAPLHSVLPSAPTAAQRISYSGPQMRWVLSVQYLGFLLTIVSVAFFVLRLPWTMIILIPFALTALGATLSLATSMRKKRFSLAQLESIRSNYAPSTYPSVDILIPTAGEGLDYLDNTFAAAAQVSWPGEINVYVLDDAANAEVEALARDHGLTYLSRPNRGHLKKAGNLRYGAEKSQGDFIAILDADFVASPDMFFDTIPHFDDPTVGIVQTPQYFDIDRTQNWLQRAAGATQVLFYRWIQPAWDSLGAAICVGTSAVYRRSALEAAGGFAQIGHSEDIYTGINLLKKGFVTRYIPTVVAKGVCPSEFNQFLSQQYRWCQGSMSLLFDKTFHRSGISWKQRAALYSGFFYYITTALNVFVEWIPVILMSMISPEFIGPTNYVFILAALMVRIALIPIITEEKGSWIGLTRIQTLYSFAHAVAIWDTLRRKPAAWVATGAIKGSTLASRIRLLTSVTLVTIQVLLWSTIALRVPEFGWGAYWPLAAFALLNLYTMLPLIVGSVRKVVPRRFLVEKADRVIQLPMDKQVAA